jgi:replicative DNA helicase
MAGIDTQPPHDDMAERAVIGSCFIDPNAINILKASLTTGDFYATQHQWVWDAILQLASNRQPIDIITVRKMIEASGKLDELGGAVYLSKLLTSVPTALHAQGYAEIVKAKSTDRQLLKLASDIAQDAYSDKPTNEKISHAYEAMRSVVPISGRSEPISNAAKSLLDDVEYYADHPIGEGQVRGFSLGIERLDKLTGGLQTDDLTVITARPGIGKTALVLQSADVLAEQGKRVLLYSLEMRAKRVLRRMASRRAKVDFKRIDRGCATGDELGRVMAELGNIAELPIIINDDNHVTSAMIAAEVDRLRPDLVIIDNLNIMLEPHAYNGENDVKRIGRISRNLKIIANDYLTPVVCIAHMNRANETRGDKRPQLSDLRDTGEIEQNADNVLGMYRDIKGEQQAANIVEVWPLKLRDGDISQPVKFIFNGVFYDFVPAETRTVFA